MNVTNIMLITTKPNISKMIENTEITLITKKTRKETKVFVCWFNEKTNILCGMYTNKFNELAVKQFDMSKYDYCL